MVSFDAKIPAVQPTSYTFNRTPGRAENFRTLESSLKTKLFEFMGSVKTMAGNDLEAQNALFHFNQLSMDEKSALTYDGRPIVELSSQEASELITEDGFFGAAKTSGRISDFVLAGAGDDLERLKVGREGILNGFQEAEKLWGGKLPDISYETLEKSLEVIDDRIKDLGGSVVDLTA